MNNANIISRLKKSKITGRGGANFLVWSKWSAVKKAKAKKKYIICNAAESEPNTFKDGFILNKYSDIVINGIDIALNYLGKNTQAIIYLKPEYFKKYKKKLNNSINKLPIEIFKKTGGYLCGEETTLINDIESKPKEPRLKPPFPTISGLWNYPTLVNNTETFYYISKLAKNEYNNTRFVSIFGNTKNKGVFEISNNLSIKEILKKTNNYPKQKFFIQAGGGASGEFIDQSQLNQKLKYTGSIIIFNKKTTNIAKLLKNIIRYFHKENCNKCVPCREGVYRINEMIKNNELDSQILDDLMFTMNNTSFCALGKSVSSPIKSLLKINTKSK